MKYKLTDEAKLQAAFPQFLKKKTIKVEQVINVLDQRKVNLAVRAGIEVPGVEVEGE